MKIIIFRVILDFAIGKNNMMNTANLSNRRRKLSLFIFLLIIVAASLPSAFAQVSVEDPAVATEDAVEETPVEETPVEEAPIETPVVDEKEVDSAAASVEAAEVAAELQKAKEEQERKEALEQAAEEAAAKATEETMTAAADDEDDGDDGSNVKAGLSALQKSVATKVAEMAERVKGIAVTKQKVKKAAAATLGIWGAATGFGWAMHHFGAEKAAA